MAGTDTFRLKKEAQLMQTAAPFIFGIFAVLFLIVAFMKYQSQDMTVALCLGGLGLISVVIAAAAVMNVANGPSYVRLSDEGVNINGQAVFRWAAVQSVKEEDVVIKARAATVRKKQLVFKYTDRKTSQIKQAIITSDYEGYDFIREKVRNQTADRFTTAG